MPSGLVFHHQNLADQCFSDAVFRAVMSVLEKAGHPAGVIRTTYPALTSDKFFILRQNLEASYSNQFLPNALFRNVYEEPNGIWLVNQFLVLLADLPGELRILQAKTHNYFAFKWESIFNAELAGNLRALTDKKIVEVLLTDRQFLSMTLRQQQLFTQILITLRNKYSAMLDINRVQQSLCDTTLLTEENVSSTLGLTKGQVYMLLQTLDAQMKERFVPIFSKYFQSYMKSNPSVDGVKHVLQELQAFKSELAFFNKQFGYPVTHQKLIDYHGEHNCLSEKEELPTYQLCLLAYFNEKFIEGPVSKIYAAQTAHKLISMIASQEDSSIQQKLTQFQILFSLAEVYANTHANPWIDKKLRIKNTNTWKILMADIRNAAFAQLTAEKNYPHPLEITEHLSVLESAIKLPLFTRHRDNYANFFFKRKTNTVNKIQAQIDFLKQPTRETSAHLTQ